MLRGSELVSKIKRIKLLVLDVDGVLTDGRVYFDTDGRESRAFHYQDIMGVSRLKKKGVEVALISGEENTITDKFAEKMKIEKIYQGCKEKDKALKDLARYYKTGLSNVCFMGDDVNDISAFKIAGLAVSVPDARKEVRKHAHLVTDSPGGYGAVREVCELFIKHT